MRVTVKWVGAASGRENSRGSLGADAQRQREKQHTTETEKQRNRETEKQRETESSRETTKLGDRKETEENETKRNPTDGRLDAISTPDTVYLAVAVVVVVVAAV